VAVRVAVACGGVVGVRSTVGALPGFATGVRVGARVGARVGVGSTFASAFAHAEILASASSARISKMDSRLIRVYSRQKEFRGASITQAGADSKSAMF